MELCFFVPVEVAADWLACFPSLGARWLFYEFFRQAPPMETLLNLVPFPSSDHGMEENSDVGLESRTAASAQAKRYFISKSFLVDFCMPLAVPL